MAWNMYDDNDDDICNSVLMIFTVMNMSELWSIILLCSTWCDLRYDDDSNGYDDMIIVYVK